jgi:hypothetical protein
MCASEAPASRTQENPFESSCDFLTVFNTLESSVQSSQQTLQSTCAKVALPQAQLHAAHQAAAKRQAATGCAQHVPKAATGRRYCAAAAAAPSHSKCTCGSSSQDICLRKAVSPAEQTACRAERGSAAAPGSPSSSPSSQSQLPDRHTSRPASQQRWVQSSHPT